MENRAADRLLSEDLEIIQDEFEELIQKSSNPYLQYLIADHYNINTGEIGSEQSVEKLAKSS
jgi:hypothetical protein